MYTNNYELSKLRSHTQIRNEVTIELHSLVLNDVSLHEKSQFDIYTMNGPN